MNPKDVKFVYEENPELKELGTATEYYKYLKNVFPESKVKDIFWHRGPEKIKNAFDKSKTKEVNGNRFYFSPFNTWRYGSHATLVLLDIKNLADPYNDKFINEVNKKHPEYTKGKSKWFDLPSSIYMNANKYGYDGVFAFEDDSNNEYSVYEPEQIHILGSKKDIEGFKEYVNKKKDSLEKRVVSSTFIAIFTFSLFLISSNITGNIIGNMTKLSSNMVGIILFLFSILGFFIYIKLKRR